MDTPIHRNEGAEYSLGTGRGYKYWTVLHAGAWTHTCWAPAACRDRRSTGSRCTSKTHMLFVTTRCNTIHLALRNSSHAWLHVPSRSVADIKSYRETRAIRCYLGEEHCSTSWSFSQVHHIYHCNLADGREHSTLVLRHMMQDSNTPAGPLPSREFAPFASSLVATRTARTLPVAFPHGQHEVCRK